ncbi:hypothetical protein BN1007_70095 [Klebsiella variicola]|nr:hypothetical protein BN1007_70095 [Klebsiella variicola]CTQ24565.1 hypothetical protein BN1200_540044 [Klebsiella variicola]
MDWLIIIKNITKSVDSARKIIELGMV